ncbi:MAG: ABC transporter permease [Lachnospiraceae bacterium]|nr:ABC transporter permease [Lachnospiraceae bacterium]
MKVFLGKTKNKIRFTTFLICVVVAFVCLCLLHETNQKERESNAAARWKSDNQEFSYISVYISPEENWKENDRNMLISNLKMSFQQNSIINKDREDNNEGLIKDCFSCEDVMEFTNGKNTATAKVTATGGDFFFFHQPVWLSGFAYSDNDVMEDRAVIDKELAWQLFGGENVTGMPFKINGNTYYVAGVVDTSQLKEDKKAYGETSRAWLPYSAFCKEYQGNEPAPGETTNIGINSMADTGTGTDGQSDKLPITCYEIVLPDPVKEWAVNLIQTSLNAKERKMVVIENSKRTNFLYVIDNLKNFFYKTSGTQPVAYPYWENAAKVRDTKREIYTGIILVALIYPVLLFIRIIIWIYKTIDGKIKKRINKKHAYPL